MLVNAEQARKPQSQLLAKLIIS